MIKNGMRPAHPGKVQREDYMKPLGMSANGLSVALRVPGSRVRGIVRERSPVTGDTALRLERYVGRDTLGWINMQMAYDLNVAEKVHAKAIAREVN